MKTDLQILYQAVGKKKGTKRVSQFDSQRYETESAKPEIKNYATDYALLRFVNQNLKTEQALRTPEIQDFTTESAIAASGAESFHAESAQDSRSRRFFNAESTQDSRNGRFFQRRERSKHQKQKIFQRRERSRQQKQKIFQRREHSKHQKQKIFQRRERSKHQKIFQPREHSEHWRQRIFSTQKALKISRTENFAASGRDSLKSQNGELGSFVASMDTEDVPMKGKAEENDGYMSADRQLSEQDIRMNAVAEMKKGNTNRLFSIMQSWLKRKTGNSCIMIRQSYLKANRIF